MRISCLGVVFLCCTSLFAFEGRVVFRDGKPVKDATVSLLGYPGSSRTDQNGNFTWSPEPSLPVEVLVVMPGGQYMAPVLVEELPGEGPLVITVEPLVAESITVTAAATPNIEAPPASGMSVVPEESIQVRHPVRLTDTIENLPGAGRVSDLHAAVPSLRGLARGRTLILIDGARVTTERRAGASATYLDPFFLEGVEVSRGPGSVAYGSDAFGGVIHARTRHPDPGSPLRVRFRGGLGAGLPEKNFGVEVVQGFEEGGLVFQARYRDFDEYTSPEGKVLDSQAKDRGFLARFGHEVGAGQLSIGWQSDHGRDTGRPTTRSDRISTSYPREDSERLTISYDLDPRLGFTRLGLMGFFGSYRLVTERDNLPTATANRRTLGSDVSAKDFSLRGLAARPFGEARLEVGLDINGRFNLGALNTVESFDDGDVLESSIEEIAIGEAGRTDAAAYATVGMLIGQQLTGSGGLRFDHVTTRNRGGFFGELSTTNGAWSGFASLKADITSGLSWTGQVARGFRDPILSDRYFRGVSGRGLVTGNPEIDPETSLQFDMALRFVKQRFRGAVYVYHYRIRDLIERFEEGEDLFFFRNRGEGRIQGVELEVQGEVGWGATYEIGAHIVDGKTLGDDSPLDDIPTASVKLQLRKALGAGHYVQIQFGLFGEDDKPGPTEKVTPAYANLDIGAGWRIGSRFRLRALLRNVLDKSYPVSADQRAVLAPGINGVVVLVGEL